MITHSTPLLRYFCTANTNWRFTYESHDWIGSSAVLGRIRRICPSQNTARGWNGGAGVNACGASFLKHSMKLESIVMRAVSHGEGRVCVFYCTSAWECSFVHPFEFKKSFERGPSLLRIG